MDGQTGLLLVLVGKGAAEGRDGHGFFIGVEGHEFLFGVVVGESGACAGDF